MSLLWVFHENRKKKWFLIFFSNQPKKTLQTCTLESLDILSLIFDNLSGSRLGKHLSSDVFPFELESIFTDKKGYKKNPLPREVVSEMRDQYCFPETSYYSLFPSYSCVFVLDQNVSRSTVETQSYPNVLFLSFS